jgi:hypothetical protein
VTIENRIKKFLKNIIALTSPVYAQTIPPFDDDQDGDGNPVKGPVVEYYIYYSFPVGAARISVRYETAVSTFTTINRQ